MTQIRTYYEIYRDPERGWCWQFCDTDGQVIAKSSDAYKDRGDCLRAIVCVRQSAPSRIYQASRRPQLRPPACRKTKHATPGRVVSFPACNREEVLEC